MAQTSELTTEGYHQHRESPVGNNYEETLGYAAALGNVADSYYNSYNSSSVFNVSSRFNQVYPQYGHSSTRSNLLHTQPTAAVHQYSTNIHQPVTQQHHYYNNSPAAYYGWVSSVPLGAAGGTDHGGSQQSNHFMSPLGQAHYTNHHSNVVCSTGLYNHHQYTTTTGSMQQDTDQPAPSIIIQHHAAAASVTQTGSVTSPPSSDCSTAVSATILSPSITWSNNYSSSTTTGGGGYPFTTNIASAHTPNSTTDRSDSSSFTYPPAAVLVPSHQVMMNNSDNSHYSLSLRDDSPNSSTGIEGPGPFGLIADDDGRPQSRNHERNVHDRGGEPEEEEDHESYLSSPVNNDGENEPKKPKRTRTAFTTHQLDQLEICFSNSSYPDAFTRDEIAKHLSIKEDRIQVWFQNRRARQRKQERTGSVSIRSRSRQQRVQRLKEAQIYYGGGSSTGYPTNNITRNNSRIMSPHSTQTIPQFSFQSAVSAVPTTEPYQQYTNMAGAVATNSTHLSHLPLLSTTIGTSPTNVNTDHN